jgi:hypothetical protein
MIAALKDAEEAAAEEGEYLIARDIFILNIINSQYSRSSEAQRASSQGETRSVACPHTYCILQHILQILRRCKREMGIACPSSLKNSKGSSGIRNKSKGNLPRSVE